jgi:hypothetical protein
MAKLEQDLKKAKNGKERAQLKAKAIKQTLKLGKHKITWNLNSK